MFVRDFGSTSGTFVNGRQIKGEIELLNGDELRVGPLLFAGAGDGVGGSTHASAADQGHDAEASIQPGREFS